MRIIGLDLGSKTLGVSVSDNIPMIASGITTIRFSENNSSEVLEPLKKIVNEYDAKAFVLGLPKNMDNTIGKAAERSCSFKEMLENTFNLPVILQDERLSSVSANKVLLQADVSRKKRKEKVDTIAATIILQNYLDTRKEK